MYINYDIISIIEDESNVTVEARFYEGNYQDVESINEDGNKIIEHRYVRSETLYDLRKQFVKDTTKESINRWFTDFMIADGTRTPLWT